MKRDGVGLLKLEGDPPGLMKRGGVGLLKLEGDPAGLLEFDKNGKEVGLFEMDGLKTESLKICRDVFDGDVAGLFEFDGDIKVDLFEFDGDAAGLLI